MIRSLWFDETHKHCLLHNIKKILFTAFSCGLNFLKIVLSQISKAPYFFLLWLRRGSTIVEHEVIANKTEKANQDLVTSMFILSKSNIKYENENLTTSSVLVKDDTGRKLGMFILCL